MNYRSVTVFGPARIVEDMDAKKKALRTIVDSVMPGRREELRLSTERELKMTGVIAVDIEAASAKISDKMPDDDPADLDTPVWAGILPLEARFTMLRGDEHVAEGIEPSDAVRAMEGKKL